MLPPLPPLLPGTYTVSASVTFSQAWCDGTSADPLTCLPAGTMLFYSRDFTTVAPRPTPAMKQSAALGPP